MYAGGKSAAEPSVGLSKRSPWSMTAVARLVALLIAVICVLVLISAVAKSLDDDLAELVAAKYTWQEKCSTTDYVYDLRRGGENARRIWVDQGVPHNEAGSVLHGPWMTVKDMFDLRLESLKPEEKENFKVEMQFDSRFGYPTRFSVTYPRMRDAAAAYQIAMVRGCAAS